MNILFLVYYFQKSYAFCIDLESLTEGNLRFQINLKLFDDSFILTGCEIWLVRKYLPPDFH